ncbi:amino acid ABC transporter substrate-binding protein [Chitinivorax sp. PXF-14]|uniref:amino acid ABC transporter substrate-binding protein n=1 Tax=Chitinivorax sp. PXF-14 TaxID=3230488 RepID=UPI003466E2C6
MLASHTSRLRCIAAGIVLAAAGTAGADTLRLCHDEEEGATWRDPERQQQGLSFVIVRQLEQLAGVHFQLVGRSWKRCLAELQANLWDGAFAVSFKPSRQAIGVFPMKGGEPDPALRVRTDGYSLFRLRGSQPGWDGRQFSHVQGMIGAQSGYSIIDQLHAAKVTVDDSSRNIEVILHKLLAGRLDGAALLTSDGMQTIASRREYEDAIERVDPPLVT